ncbi:hypothetical protein [Pontibacter sp. G13]|uniref:hypothetical protein n=1 Tax=Pontibacter sp. G13 TaxID=3074898 RepID=UPI00288BF24E|nr:hypothetical protein [Pontibacter sp. G13]WNJ16933.1 hypothetical protein RJD25_18935 [Pontibacter sp. G13]
MYISSSFRFFTLLVLAFVPFYAMGQAHVAPAHGANGVPGPFDQSFLIKWEYVPAAIGYEYVLSDNRFCFAGCAGDTRQARVPDTVALEFELTEGITYYWITRVHYPDSTGSWSLISSFEAITPDFTELLRIYPNPTSEQVLSLHVDWGVDPTSNLLEYEVLDLQGRSISGVQSLNRDNLSDRLTDIRIPTSGLGSGLHVIRYRSFSPEGTERLSGLEKVWIR